MIDELLVPLQKIWPLESHAWLEQVPDRTGGANRTADAVAISCWPSRGLHTVGFEVKRYRGDFTCEIKDPTKSAPIQRFCRMWYVVTPPGIVREGELPATWGLIEVLAGKAKVVTSALILTPDPLEWPFVAALLRTASHAVTAAAERGRKEGTAAERERAGGGAEGAARIVELERALLTEKANHDHVRGRLAEIEKAGKEIGAALGLSVYGLDFWTWRPEDQIRTKIRAAEVIGPSLLDAADRFERAAAVLREGGAPGG